MITLRKSDERGFADHGWLKSWHTFSFANYQDPKHVRFSVLRVINEDKIEGGEGFGTHPHNDMEIITYVIKGALEHKDSMGNSTIIRPGEVQRMTAGTGVTHSEFNHFKDQDTHLLQIWIFPDKKDYKPGYGQKSFEEASKKNNFVLVVSQDGREGSITMNQDASLYLSKPKAKEKIHFDISAGRKVWIQVVRGNLLVNDIAIKDGDGLSASDEKNLQIVANKDSEFLLFDLP